jgi:predicted RNA binding protein YcfA (HicA-like mRNA interferase family)
MSKLPVISSKEIIKILCSIGFEDAPKRGKGSHVALIKKTIDTTKLVIIPDRKTLPKGTIRAILEQAGVSRDEFINLMEK